MKIAEKVQVKNSLGLHLRNAARLVLLVGRYTCEVVVQKGLSKTDARSIIGLVSLAVTSGSELEFVFDGEDAEEARQDVRSFFNDISRE